MIKSITSPFQTPAQPGVLCVILDASFDPDLHIHVEQAVALFDNTPYAALQQVGPVALLCPPDAASMHYANELLERADAGCVAYLKNTQCFEQAVEHWQSLLTVSTDDAPMQLMRFFDPRWLEPLLRSLSETERLQFLGPLSAMAWRNELGWRHLPRPVAQSSPRQQAPGWLHVGRERQAKMDEQRLQVLAIRFAEDYRGVIDVPEPNAFVFRQLCAAQQAGYLQTAEQERWLRLALIKGDGFWCQFPHAQLLARDDLSLGDKLDTLEQI